MNRSWEPSPNELATVAREVGERLAADLKRAESLTGEWRDAEAGYAAIAAAMDRCLARLAATGCWGKGNQLPSGELWAAAGHWLEVSWLQHRARFKPCGYAGDFEMFERFWRRQCCDHPLGRLFDRYFQEQAAVEAVRARTEKIAAALVEHRFAHSRGGVYRVASVGCGPAIDIAIALQRLPDDRRSQVQATLFDLDQAALDNAVHRLGDSLAPRQVIAVRENLYRLADKPAAAEMFRGANFLICSGLFDYLPDEAAEKLLRLFWRQLAPGGRLMVGNFAPHNPTRAYMEWIGNWYLIYRTAEELERLAVAAGIESSVFSIGAERMEIDLFVMAEKPGEGDCTQAEPQP